MFSLYFLTYKLSVQKNSSTVQVMSAQLLCTAHLYVSQGCSGAHSQVLKLANEETY